MMTSIGPLSYLPSPLSSSTSCQEITITRAPFSAIPRNVTACVDPAAFGRECDSHWTRVFDSHIKPKDWYFENWCFVDPVECQSVSTFDANILGQDLALSYAACNSAGTYQFRTRYEHLRKETIRIAYPHGDGDIYNFGDEGNRDGVAEQFFRQVFLDALDFEVVEQNISEESLSRFASPYTACVHDIAIGAVDLCPAPFYLTTDRLLLAEFTASYASSKMQLVVNKADYDGANDGTTFWRWVWTPLLPFSWRAWVAIILSCLYMELAKRVIHKKLEGKRIRNPIKELGAASFDAVVSITAGGEVFIPDKTSSGEKIMIAGFAVFALVFMSAYTASFTLTLVNEAEETSLESLKGIVKLGGKVCVLESAQELMLDSYSFLSADDLIPAKEFRNAVDGLNDRNCMGSILPEEEFNKMAADDEDFCATKMQVGDTLLEIPMATPSSKKFADALNYVVLNATNYNVFDDLFDEYLDIYFGKPICDDDRRMLLSADDEHRQLATATSASSAGSGANNGSSGTNLTIAQMSLPLLVTLLCTTIGLFSFSLSNYRHHVLNNLDHHLISRGNFSRQLDQEIRGGICRMPTSELIGAVWDGFPQGVVAKAMNQLPDRGPLESILFQQRRGDMCFKDKFSAVWDLNVAQIYRALIEDGDRTVMDQANEALDSVIPKRALVDVAMRHEGLAIAQYQKYRKVGTLDKSGFETHKVARGHEGQCSISDGKCFET